MARRCHRHRGGASRYSNGLRGPFVFDDRLSIVESPHIREWWRAGALLFPERERPTAGRPLVNLSLAINYAFGGLDPLGYHIVNLALHLLPALIVFGVVRRTLEPLANRLPVRPVNLGVAAALVWTLHPLNTEAVNYLAQRTGLMMSLFYLLTLYASLRGRYSLASVSCAAGVACKESMARRR